MDPQAGESGGPVEEFSLLLGSKVSSFSDLPDNMLRDGILTAQRALSQISDATWGTAGNAAVEAVKAHFDATYGPSWHCVIGSNFSSRCAHDSATYCFFYVGVSLAHRTTIP